MGNKAGKMKGKAEIHQMQDSAWFSGIPGMRGN
jgi:hypothetical protein